MQSLRADVDGAVSEADGMSSLTLTEQLHRIEGALSDAKGHITSPADDALIVLLDMIVNLLHDMVDEP